MSERQVQVFESTLTWPTQPGIYMMKDAVGKIIYVGKAKNLRNRIRSYFHNPDKLGVKTQVLVKKIEALEFQVTHTELEALLLECNLIKKHRPRYNIRLKDDKNFPYIVLDFSHDFPVIKTTRRVVQAPHLRHFGPFSGGVREISRLLLKAFQIRDCSETKYSNRSRPCLNYEIGTCTAPCVKWVTKEKYARQIQDAVDFLEGRIEETITRLKDEMLEASEKTEYERAKSLRDRIGALERLSERQNAVLIDHREDIDIIGYFDAATEIQWGVLFLRGGFLTGRRLEKTPPPLLKDERFETFLEQFYDVSLIPNEIWVGEDFENRESLSDLLSQKAGKKVQIKVPTEESAIRLLGMAQENARLAYEDNQKKSPLSASQELQQVLNLAEMPDTIEGIDVSNFQGSSPAVALVHFAGERPLKSRYRVYHPNTVEGQNDFAMIHEVVTRRFNKSDPPPPDLLLIDGGKGQLNAAVQALETLGVTIPICALAKARTDSSFTSKTLNKSEERIFIPGRKNPIILKPNNAALNLLQKVRDEAHRFSVKSHQIRRKAHATHGNWDELEGVGPKTKDLLMKHFETWENFSQATLEDLQTAGLSAGIAQKIFDQISTPDPEE